MKRKIIQIADSTQLISLPRKWCIKNNIKKGDELEVVEEQNRITITAGADKKENERVVLNISGMGHTGYTVVSALYKAGHDEFKIYFKTAEELRMLQDTIKNKCAGFEIVEQGKNFVIAKKISEPITEEFEVILRRAFVFLQNMIQNSYPAIVNKDTNALDTVVAMDDSLNKFSFFCRRILNKKGKGSYRVTSALYYIVDALEELGDKYKHLCRGQLKSDHALSKQTIALLQETNKLVEMFIEQFYKPDLQKMDALFEMRKKIDREAYLASQKVDRRELPALADMTIIADRVHEMKELLILAKYEPELEKTGSA